MGQAASGESQDYGSDDFETLSTSGVQEGKEDANSNGASILCDDDCNNDDDD